MSASRDALIRAVDALRGPQGATPEEPVAPPKCLKKQAAGHRGHRGHSKTIDLGPDDELVPSRFPLGEQRRAAPPPKVYSPSVAPVAHVAPGIDSERKNRGHTTRACGPLWPPDSGILPSIPDIPARWIQGIVRLGGLPPAPNYPTPAWQQLIVDAQGFLERWGAQAARLNWQDWELFGCHHVAPWGRIQGMGLVLLLRGRELAALTESEAAIRTASGARNTYRRKPQDPLHPSERRLIWELGNDCSIRRSTTGLSASNGRGGPRHSGGGPRDARL
jgi:hypothetical protein